MENPRDRNCSKEIFAAGNSGSPKNTSTGTAVGTATRTAIKGVTGKHLFSCSNISAPAAVTRQFREGCAAGRRVLRGPARLRGLQYNPLNPFL